MVLDKFVRGYIEKEIPFAEQKIKDYFSPQGTFPDEMLLADELRKQTYEVPKGYTEQEAMELLAMFGCSDECLRGVTVSQSSAHNLSMDPEKNKALVQVFMMISNSLGANDYNRQKGLSEAYINARKKFRELSGQMEQGNLTETRKLFSEGIKNIILVDKGVGRAVDIKGGRFRRNPPAGNGTGFSGKTSGDERSRDTDRSGHGRYTDCQRKSGFFQ